MIGQHVRRMRLTGKRLFAAAAIGGCFLFLMQTSAPAWEILGTGTGSLLGSDLTDPDNNGDPEFDIGYDAIFDASDEPGFGGGEFFPLGAPAFGATKQPGAVAEIHVVQVALHAVQVAIKQTAAGVDW